MKANFHLRLSITDRCNFKCAYCIPKDKISFLPREEILSYEEYLTLISIFLDLGMDSIRITGGEPLLRRGIEQFIYSIKRNFSIGDVSLTTNGFLLLDKIEDLKNAGLDRLNVSLDTLSPEKFSYVTGTKVETFFKVMKGIERALKEGLKPLKINTVLMKGINDDEIDNFITFSAEKGIIVRFIELMSFGGCSFFRNHFMKVDDLKRRIEKKYGSLIPVDVEGEGPARNFIVPGAGAKIGFIYSNSHKKCKECNRLRLSANGQLRFCIFSKDSIALKFLLRKKFKNNPEQMRAFIFSILKKWSNLSKKASNENSLLPGCMNSIGG